MKNIVYFAMKFSESDYEQQTMFLFDYGKLMNAVNDYTTNISFQHNERIEYKRNIEQLDNIKDLNKQIAYLEKTINENYKQRNELVEKLLKDSLENSFYGYNLDNFNLDSIIEVYSIIRQPALIPALDEYIENNCLDSRIELSVFEKYVTGYLKEHYNLELTLSDMEFIKAIEISISGKQIAIELLKIKLNLLKSINKYKNSINKYDFSECIFNKNEKYVIEFSNYLENNSDKIIYLKYILSLSKGKAGYSTELIESEIEKLENILKYDTKEQLNTKEKMQDKPEKNKPLNKFTWNDTEENILLLFHCLNQTGLINDKDFENIGSILQDTFLNKKGTPFINTQINVKKDVLNKVKKLTTKKNFSLIKLSDELKKLIPD